MPAWEWMLVALLAFGALQLLALRYALRRERPEVGSRVVGPYAVEPTVFEDAAMEDAGTGERRCPRCGTENRPGFTYCRNCVGVLPA